MLLSRVAAAAFLVSAMLPGARSERTLLTMGRLHYDGGGDWYANPSSLPNLLAAIRERTALPVAARERVVSLDGPDLWEAPYL